MHFDDVDLILDADGWRFPTDEELRAEIEAQKTFFYLQKEKEDGK